MDSAESTILVERLGSMIQPSLIKQLKSVLDQYPKGQILKEMIQNAEDAGARVVKVLYEGRQCNRPEDLATLEYPSHLKALQGPGLCVFNDAEFSAKDWEGIQMINCSIKEHDRLKVGRYGLGFKSVFHVTDWLCVISGEFILFINPHQPKDEVCLMIKIANLDKQTKDAVFSLFGGTFDFSKTNLENGSYKGTLFWFPLRQRKSDLSENVYTESDVMDLFTVFATEAEMTLLFLKSLECILLFKSPDSLRATQSVFTVQLGEQCLETVRKQRNLFKSKLGNLGDSLPSESCHSTSHLSIECIEFQYDQPSKITSQDWIVVNFYKGGSASDQLTRLCADTELSYSPYVGVAYPLSNACQLNGHVFCFLPLPHGAENTTGLPVHVNGFFALTQDRREIKSSEDGGNQNQWNHCLISEVIPEAYLILVKELKQHCQAKKNSSDVIQFFYGSLPDHEKITGLWKSFLKPFYNKLSQMKIFFSKVDGGKWLHWKDIVLALYENDDEYAVCKTVTKTYIECQKNIVELPDHLMERLKKKVPKVSPEGLCSLLKTSKLYIDYTADERMDLLKYVLQSSSNTSLEGLALLPVADGTFQKFSENQVFFCPGKVHLFPGLERKLVLENLDSFIEQQFVNMTKQGFQNLKELTAETFPELIRACFCQTFQHGAPVVLQRSSPILGEQWLKDVWSCAHELGLDMQSSFSDLPLVPEFSDDTITLHPLTDLFIAASVRGLDTLPEEISQCVKKLDVIVLPYVPDYIELMIHVGSDIQFPTPQGVIKILGRLSETNIEHFNRTAGESIKDMFVEYLASCKEIQRDAKKALRSLKLFRNTSSPERNMSVADLNQIVSIEKIPVMYPTVYLYEQSTTVRDLAIRLGAQEVSTIKVICEVLDIMADRKQYSSNDVQLFMRFVLENGNFYLKDPKVKQKASLVAFLPSYRDEELHRVKELFDPRSSFLQELFYGEDKFPNQEFSQSDFLNELQKIGLKRDNDVSLTDICNSASITEDILIKNSEEDKVIKKGRAILTVLKTINISDVKSTKLLSCHWMPVLTERPVMYPNSLPFAIGNGCVIGRPIDMCNYAHLPLVGSVRVVTKETLPNKIAAFFEKPPEDVVLEHLRNIIDTYTADEHQKYMTQLDEVYKHLSRIQLSPKAQIKLATRKVVWTGEDAEFVKADKIWINHSSTDVILTPYRHELQKSLKCFSHFFHQIGAPKHQTSKVLMDVLYEIQQKHKHHTERECVLNDLSLVMKILNVVKGDTSINKKKILIPVYNHERRLVLMEVEECTYCESYELLDDDDEEEVDDEIEDNRFAQISSDLARDLGVRILTNPLMDATEEFDMNFGQKELLTQRLKNLLHEYTDGFSVPKEIIQNADDAGASEVNFLFDERDNLDARTNLINKGMASLQGPALWAQNDALFSNSDFANITKLSGETKLEDATKIGRFGLGFNSVYNLTDVPSFISGNHIVIFDPHQTYLGSPGMKADLKVQKNKLMLRKMKDQFKPFEGVFGCHLVLTSNQTGYSGTLFRFPLRTSLQAQQSQISGLSYSPSEMKKLLHVFASSAGNLLLFCQNVKTVRMYHLPKNISDASKATLLVEVQKKVENTSIPQSRSVLKFFSEVWKEKCHHKNIRTRDVVNENISISLVVYDAATELCSTTPTCCEVKWTVAWVLGSKESAQMAKTNKMKGLLPVAAAAVPFFEKQGQTVLLPLSECPGGFYTEGHLFCFLPLPIKFPLPLHINGAFALTHDRKQLCSKSEDEKSVSPQAEWNAVLQSDAVTSAVIQVLAGLKSIGDINAELFYKLWPKCEMLHGTLFKKFHERVVSENHDILLYNGLWVSFQNAVFLDPLIHFSKNVGQAAFKAFEHYYNGQRVIIDIPENILEGFAKAGLKAELMSHTLRMDEFYKDFFFPNIDDTYWNNEDRDGLVIFALLHGSAKVKNLTKVTPCIPTRPSGKLKRPQELVNPNCKTALLFLDSDGVFPSDSKHEGDMNGFCTSQILEALTAVGMQNEELQWSVVLERVQSIKTLNSNDANNRCKNILYYLGVNRIQKGKTYGVHQYKQCPDMIKNKIQHEMFLPILKKPQNWPTAWHGSDSKSKLGSPQLMFFEECKFIVGSNKCILDPTWLDLSLTKNVLEWLGVQFKKNVPVSDVIEHLLSISLTKIETINKESYQNLSNMCSDIYLHLNQTCSSQNTNGSNEIFEKLHSKPIILQGKTFIKPKQMAMSLDYFLEPYLYKVDKSAERQYRSFLQATGVRNTFEPIDAANVMTQIAESCGTNALSEKELHSLSQAASLLVHLMNSSEPGCVTSEFGSLYLPDKRGVLHPVSELCLDDCEWIHQRNSMKFLHHTMPVNVAVAFGIKTKRQEDVKSHAVLFDIQSFGQHENLTNRLKRILEGYPCDSSLMKELLQNADDAGASELMFIKDFRTHPSDRIFDDRWKSLQGPALVVYNNSYFTQKDLDGIQDLGLGSKGDDPLKTGQYGVGFNVVYHLTDVPTFLTVGPETEETLCVLDPNCLYTPTAEPGIPGARFNNIPELRESYRDVFSCFLEDKFDLSTQGTLFRFPLRTKDMASQSSICKTEMSTSKLEGLLNSFMDDMAESLLFLHNVRKITVAFVQKNGVIETERVVEAFTSVDNNQKQDKFLNNLREQVKETRYHNKGISQLQEKQILINLKIKDSYEEEEEEWLVVHQFGFSANHDMPHALEAAWTRKDINLLPRGGVAARIDVQQAECDKKAFCILPLPVQTGLPVHINGHFALDHEARRNLWHDTSDHRSSWNTHMVEALIVPAYLTAIKQMQSMFEDIDHDKVQQCIEKYNTLFPNSNQATDTFWKSLVSTFYKTVFHHRLRLFPVVNNYKEFDNVSWVAVFVDKGFPGFFNNLESYYPNVDNEQNENKRSCLPSSYPSGGFFARMKSIFGKALQSGVSTTDHANEDLSHQIPYAKSVKLASLLKRIAMKVIEAPMWIYTNFTIAGLGDHVQCVNPENVITFLKSCNSEKDEDRCCVGELPQQVDCTPFCDTETVRFLITFCQKDKDFLTKIVGLPLCLTNSCRLGIFQTSTPILVTKFTDLIKGSSDKCLHKNIADLFLDSTGCLALKKMDISDLSMLLCDTIDASVLKCGLPCVWNQGDPVQPTDMWINTLWTFLLCELQKEFKEGNLSVLNFGKLKEWSLLPCTITREDKDMAKSIYINQLYPIEKANLVIDVQNFTNRKLDKTLKTLGLPCFNSSPFHSDVAIFAASITANPKSALTMLIALSNHNYVNITLTADTGCTLLEYFCNNLEELKSDKKQMINMLKSLPFFATVTKSTLPLVNCGNPVFVKDRYPVIPRDGLDIWSSQTNVIVFKYEPNLKYLYTFMNITAITSEGFYSEHVLPKFDILPREAKAAHLKHIKDNLLHRGFAHEENIDKTNLIYKLKTLPFIEKLDGTLCRANEFYSNKEIVFQVMCPPAAFPPAPYDNEEWHDFLVLAGMVDKVSVDLFVQFAEKIQTLGKTGITPNVVEMSSTLTGHLILRPQLLQENLIEQIKNIKFLLPFCMKEDHSYGKEMDSIQHQFENASKLIAFNGSVSSEHCYLVWSSCTMFPQTVSSLKNRNVLQHLGIQEKPQKDNVIKHLKNVSNSLEKMKVTDMNDIKTCLQNVMHSCYEYLNTNGVTEQDKQTLQEYPVIYLPDCGVIVKARDIVIELAKDDVIRGYIFQPPVYFGKFYSVFESLGACKIVSANHYAEVLVKMHQQIGDGKLTPNDWIVVQKAVKMLFKCRTKSDNYSPDISVSCLYLPSSQHTLVRANDLVLSNNYVLQKRVATLNLTFFIGFNELKLDVTEPVVKMQSLPEQHRPKILTSLVQEHVTTECQEKAYTGTYADRYMRCITSSPFVSGVIRLVNHQINENMQKSITEDEAKLIENTLQNLQLREVNDLRTHLVYSKSTVSKSEMSRKCFLESACNNDENGDTHILYLDKHACQSKSSMCSQISRTIDRMLKGKIGNAITHMEKMFQMDVEQIGRYLDEQEIMLSNFKNVQSSTQLFPPPGTLIPEVFHWMLDNNFDMLYEDEYVGVEVYDPLIECTRSEAEGTPMSIESSNAVYIYAIVREITKQNVCSMMMKYQVEVGDGRIEELNGIKLYKLYREKRNAGQELVLSDAKPTSPEVVDLDLNEILKEIRQTLKDAWGNLDEHNRKRVVKRLYFKWHPDKNDPSQKDICTEVCQYIQLYMSKLDKGESIDDTNQPDSNKSPRYEYSWFFDFMDTRSRSHRSHYNNYNHHWNHWSGPSSTHGTSAFHSATGQTSFPNHRESMRWLQQAKMDLEVAKKGLSNPSYDAFNWICFLSHQAAEKALKAMLYNHDAEVADKIKSHDLRSVVRNFHGACYHDLLRSVGKLEELVLDYYRMRYPDRLSFPQIPHHLYSRQTAFEACDIAEDIVQYAECHTM